MDTPSKNDLEYASFGTTTSGTAQKHMGLYDSFRGTIPITIGGVVGIGTLASSISGVVQGVTMAMGTMTGTGTAYLGLLDNLGGTVIYGTQAEGGTTYFGTIVPVNTTMNWIATSAGTQEGTASIKFNAHYQR